MKIVKSVKDVLDDIISNNKITLDSSDLLFEIDYTYRGVIMKIQQERMIKVLENMINLVKNDDRYAHVFSDTLNGLFDNLNENDEFGTEGALDPRGDFRNGEWSMFCVEGIDEKEEEEED